MESSRQNRSYYYRRPTLSTIHGYTARRKEKLAELAMGHYRIGEFVLALQLHTVSW